MKYKIDVITKFMNLTVSEIHKAGGLAGLFHVLAEGHWGFNLQIIVNKVKNLANKYCHNDSNGDRKSFLL